MYLMRWMEPRWGEIVYVDFNPCVNLQILVQPSLRLKRASIYQCTTRNKQSPQPCYKANNGSVYRLLWPRRLPCEMYTHQPFRGGLDSQVDKGLGAVSWPTFSYHVYHWIRYLKCKHMHVLWHVSKEINRIEYLYFRFQIPARHRIWPFHRCIPFVTAMYAIFVRRPLFQIW
jgi:hypothetical protein